LKRPFVIVLGVTAALVLTAILVFGWRTHNIVYRGKSLQVWCSQAYNRDPEAVAALKELGPKAVPALVDLLKTQDAVWRNRVRFRAQSLPRKMRYFVLDKVKMPLSVQVRAEAAHALGIIGPDAKAAAPALAKALHDRESIVCWEAARSLGLLGESSMPALITALRDSDPVVRHCAAYAVGEAGPSGLAAVPALISSLLDTNEQVCSSAAYSLSVLGNPGVPALIATMEKGDSAARVAAAKVVLGLYFEVPTLTPALARMARDTNSVAGQQALQTLNAIRTNDALAIKTLVAALGDPVANVRLTAIQALSKISFKAQSAIPALTVCLKDDSAAIREWSALTLGSIGTPAQPAATDLARLTHDDSDAAVRTAAQQALERIGAAEATSQRASKP
jgi:HEAT repeat protein